jgi:hypothetical protein
MDGHIRLSTYVSENLSPKQFTSIEVSLGGFVFRNPFFLPIDVSKCIKEIGRRNR